jgi:glyceraldehyde 3-phosphate dehydrogenase
VRIAINGFGRIGRTVFRILNHNRDHQVVAINDLTPPDALTYLLKYDTVMGRLKGKAELDGDILQTDNHTVKMLYQQNPAELPWKEMNVDIVIEATGVFRTRKTLTHHLDAGAGRVILTVPSKDEIDYTVVIGVNDQELTQEDKLFLTQAALLTVWLPWLKF